MTTDFDCPFKIKISQHNSSLWCFCSSEINMTGEMFALHRLEQFLMILFTWQCADFSPISQANIFLYTILTWLCSSWKWSYYADGTFVTLASFLIPYILLTILHYCAWKRSQIGICRKFITFLVREKKVLKCIVGVSIVWLAVLVSLEWIADH